MIFFLEYGLENTAASIIKIQKNLSSLSLNDKRFFQRDGPFIIDKRIVILNLSKGTHWFAYNNQKTSKDIYIHYKTKSALLLF